MDSEFFSKLKSTCSTVLQNEPMNRHTTFKIGGAADFFAIPSTNEEVINTIKLCNSSQIPYTIVGNGSNLLVSDGGIGGVVIKPALNEINVSGTKITAGAGALLSRMANTACENGLSGMEFAAGIPGSVGGAIYMNAGAYGGEMKDVIISVTYADENGNIKTVSSDKLGFGYRKSIFTGTNCIILSCEAELCPDSREKIKAKMSELSAKRAEKQPLSMPSAGSTFKRPEGHFAGTLIEQAGLKGFSIGGAQVSEKHAGFVVNTGGATCENVVKLIEHIQKTVRDKFSVELEPEIKITGRVEK